MGYGTELPGPGELGRGTVDNTHYQKERRGTERTMMSLEEG